MKSEEVEQLVLDALFDRTKNIQGTCLVTNEAGLKLVRSGRESLEVIERILHDVVAPKVARPDATDAGFTGLRYVLGAYLLISRREGYAIVPFLMTMPVAVQLETVYAVSAFFQKTPDGYNFGSAPGQHLGLMLGKLAESQDSDLRSAASAELDRIQAKDSSAFVG
ncbi:MAG TPA: hypothetical protein VF950_05205 [Planctomycetota bacterium]